MKKQLLYLSLVATIFMFQEFGWNVYKGWNRIAAEQGAENLILKLLLIYVVRLVHTLGVFLILKLFYDSHKLLCTGLLVILLFGMSYFHAYYFMFYPENSPSILQNALLGLLGMSEYTAAGVIFFFFYRSREKEKAREQLAMTAKSAQLESLRSQINPHFLFNALNNIYSLVQQGSGSALLALDKLSGLLRYSIYDAGEAVSVAEEVTAVENFIGLQRLRFRESVNIDTQIDQGILNCQLPPLVILPLVENAFKHGDATNAEKPIVLNIQRISEQLMIKVSNPIAHFDKDETGGIGLNNLRSRLLLKHGESHSFDISQAEDIFVITIHLPLENC